MHYCNTTAGISEVFRLYACVNHVSFTYLGVCVLQNNSIALLVAAERIIRYQLATGILFYRYVKDYELRTITKDYMSNDLIKEPCIELLQLYA